MAVLVTLQIPSATRDEFDALEERVGQAMATAGGPPPGLMSHVVYPEGDGFVVAEVWRSEDEGRGYLDEVLRALVAKAGLQAHVTEVRPVWSFARP